MTDDEYLSDAEREYYMNFDLLFASDGWRQLVTELKEEVEDLPHRMFVNAASFDEVLAARAAERKVQEILRYPDYVEQRRQQTITERMQEASEAAEGLASLEV